MHFGEDVAAALEILDSVLFKQIVGMFKPGAGGRGVEVFIEPTHPFGLGDLVILSGERLGDGGECRWFTHH